MLRPFLRIKNAGFYDIHSLHPQIRACPPPKFVFSYIPALRPQYVLGKGTNRRPGHSSVPESGGPEGADAAARGALANHTVAPGFRAGGSWNAWWFL